MVQFNTHTNEILLKIVYYGPGLSGKTVNLHALHTMCQKDFQGELFSVNTQEDRTLFFDLLPIRLGTLYGNSIHIQVYTVPGQPQYDATRRIVLDSADGVVFIADSSETKIQENIDSLTNLHHNLNANGLDIKHIPLVIQYNKRDLPNAMPVGVMNRKLNFRSVPYFEAVAITGTGILETFLTIAKEVFSTTFQKLRLNENVQNFNSMLEMAEASLRSSLSQKPPPLVESIGEKTTVVRQENTSVEDLPQDSLMDTGELLTDALSSGMETARLYSDLKKKMEEIESQNAELTRNNIQLKKQNDDYLKARNYLESLIQSIGEAIISFAPGGHILTWNRAAELLFGISQLKAIKSNITEFAAPGVKDEFERIINNLRSGMQMLNLSTVCIHGDGAEFPVRISFYSVYAGDSGKAIAFAGLIEKAANYRTATDFRQ